METGREESYPLWDPDEIVRSSALTPIEPVPAKKRAIGPAAPAVRSAPVTQERWLLTYADMITLLLVLFIVLVGISRLF